MDSCDTKFNLVTVEATTASYPPTVDTLTGRQREVLNLIVQGRSNKEIARILKLGPGTVKVHVSALFGKLGIHRRAAVAVVGARLSAEAVERSESNSRPGVERASSARITWDTVADFLFSLPESKWHHVGGCQKPLCARKWPAVPAYAARMFGAHNGPASPTAQR